ncbi:putative transmembrane protein [Gregarina niphandrodes]|uniref:Transmembrane protein n=1 Tax=Gregarina niphandrodes TaxID=110365 RepID=A0A023BDB9_GRENI|nr:putative transmembrane protein [Gregarina niphandrodes]EZG87456.1 putative transmembrane protein [Gregarina niphandrodes]|eukprot:XP_011128661.1 putative transmembrane protein [Gregarina niphandrodes]
MEYESTTLARYWIALWVGAFLVGVIILSQWTQKKLLQRTQAALAAELGYEEEVFSTDVGTSLEETTATSGETVNDLRRRICGLADLDTDEHAATERYRAAVGANREPERGLLPTTIDASTGQSFAATRKNAPRKANFRPLDLDKERKFADQISSYFQELKTLWPKDQFEPDPELIEHVKGIINKINEDFNVLTQRFKDDRVSASHCMSMCCTAILKFDVRPSPFKRIHSSRHSRRVFMCWTQFVKRTSRYRQTAEISLKQLCPLFGPRSSFVCNVAYRK